MKRIVRISVIIFITLFMFSFVSCIKKTDDNKEQEFEEKQEEQEEKYNIPSTISDAKKKMEKHDYTVYINYINDEEDVEGQIIATYGTFYDQKKLFVCILYKTEEAAKTAFDKYKEDFEEDFIYKCEGKWIIYGDEESVNIFIS